MFHCPQSPSHYALYQNIPSADECDIFLSRLGKEDGYHPRPETRSKRSGGVRSILRKASLGDTSTKPILQITIPEVQYSKLKSFHKARPVTIEPSISVRSVRPCVSSTYLEPRYDGQMPLSRKPLPRRPRVSSESSLASVPNNLMLMKPLPASPQRHSVSEIPKSKKCTSAQTLVRTCPLCRVPGVGFLGLCRSCEDEFRVPLEVFYDSVPTLSPLKLRASFSQPLSTSKTQEDRRSNCTDISWSSTRDSLVSIASLTSRSTANSHPSPPTPQDSAWGKSRGSTSHGFLVPIQESSTLSIRNSTRNSNVPTKFDKFVQSPDALDLAEQYFDIKYFKPLPSPIDT